MTASSASLRDEIHTLAEQLDRRVGVMEVCGTHTVSIFRTGLRTLLPAQVRLISGPGCPVCVTAQRHIDAALDLAAQPGITLATYGDMLRVPGRKGSLERLRAAGADVRIVNSARTALELALALPDRQVVFLAVGFETTAPATAATVRAAAGREIGNFSVLSFHKLIVPAMLALLAEEQRSAGGQAASTNGGLAGFLAPGHVSVIIGAAAYAPVCAQYHRPVVVTGFEPPTVLAGLAAVLRQLVANRAEVENAYSVAVTAAGNTVARALLQEVFTAEDTPWRALGTIPQSGLGLGAAWRRFDALVRFGLTLGTDEEHPLCRCGEVITGRVEPPECPAFGERCHPLDPLGPCMVSSEGTCAAWYKYHRVGRVRATS